MEGYIMGKVKNMAWDQATEFLGNVENKFAIIVDDMIDNGLNTLLDPKGPTITP